MLGAHPKGRRHVDWFDLHRLCLGQARVMESISMSQNGARHIRESCAAGAVGKRRRKLTGAEGGLAGRCTAQPTMAVESAGPYVTKRLAVSAAGAE